MRPADHGSASAAAPAGAWQGVDGSAQGAPRVVAAPRWFPQARRSPPRSRAAPAKLGPPRKSLWHPAGLSPKLAWVLHLKFVAFAGGHQPAPSLAQLRQAGAGGDRRNGGRRWVQRGERRRGAGHRSGPRQPCAARHDPRQHPLRTSSSYVAATPPDRLRLPLPAAAAAAAGRLPPADGETLSWFSTSMLGERQASRKRRGRARRLKRGFGTWRPGGRQ